MGKTVADRKSLAGLLTFALSLLTLSPTCASIDERVEDRRRLRTLQQSSSASGWYEAQSLTVSLLHDVTFPTSGTGFACGEDGVVLKTSDSGLSWRSVSPVSPNSDLTFFAASFSSAEDGYIVGEYGTMMHTLDGGLTWSLIEIDFGSFDGNSTVYDVQVVGTAVAYAAGEHGLAVGTKDGGLTWSAYNTTTLADLKGLFCLSVNQCWVVGGGGAILHTEDGGATWQAQSAGLGAEAWLESVFFTSARYGWAVGRNSTVVYTYDGGSTWAPQQLCTRLGMSTGIDFWDVAFLPGQSREGYAVGDYGTVCYTAGGGSSWLYQEIPSNLQIGSSHLRGITISSTAEDQITSQLDVQTWAVGKTGTIIQVWPLGESFQTPIFEGLRGISFWLNQPMIQTSADQVLIQSDIFTMASFDVSGIWADLHYDGVLAPVTWGGMQLDQWVHVHLQLTEAVSSSFRMMCDKTRVLCLTARLASLYTWHRALTTAEVSLLVGGWDQQPRHSGLQAYYHMEEGEGQTLADLLKRHDFIVLHGAVWEQGAPEGASFRDLVYGVDDLHAPLPPGLPSSPFPPPSPPSPPPSPPNPPRCYPHLLSYQAWGCHHHPHLPPISSSAVTAISASTFIPSILSAPYATPFTDTTPFPPSVPPQPSCPAPPLPKLPPPSPFPQNSPPIPSMVS
ncbi:hypothetical protein CYMTET_39256 [Cymbomonas tetramitiformis]|uniref:Photosynthesis system II assembly factor Ycf48/Hcf136-like domain-containing protein n=1 Tax=Cymbomonas tetramitiformis TaxID=36881 RepID=A0AAE0CAD8_9CHLO|nr:hypothetical protein CYMTET_39256 [Cymbomonas tetramitiformis]